MGDTNGFMSAEIYICLQNLPSLPIHLKQSAICLNIVCFLPHDISISESILVLEVLYLNNLTTVKEIYF